MKKNLFGLVAVVAAIALFAFTTPRLVTGYFVYDVANPNPEKSMGNWDFQVNYPGEQAGIDIPAWYRATVTNPNNITIGEFSAAFELVDGDYGGTDNDLLTDETLEDGVQFEKRAE